MVIVENLRLTEVEFAPIHFATLLEMNVESDWLSSIAYVKTSLDWSRSVETRTGTIMVDSGRRDSELVILNLPQLAD